VFGESVTVAAPMVMAIIFFMPGQWIPPDIDTVPDPGNPTRIPAKSNAHGS